MPTPEDVASNPPDAAGSLSAQYFDGQSARAHPVTLRRSGPILQIRGESIVLDLGAARMTVALTSWSESKWAGAASFDALIPTADVDELHAIFAGGGITLASTTASGAGARKTLAATAGASVYSPSPSESTTSARRRSSPVAFRFDRSFRATYIEL